MLKAVTYIDMDSHAEMIKSGRNVRRAMLKMRDKQCKIALEIVCIVCNMKIKEQFTLFSDHNRSLLRRQPGAMTIGHRPKGKGKSQT